MLLLLLALGAAPTASEANKLASGKQWEELYLAFAAASPESASKTDRPKIAAALLSSERLELANVPDVIDVDTMLALMREFGVSATRGSGRMLVLDARAARNEQAPYDMVRRMRASILVLAPLLARFGSARVSICSSGIMSRCGRCQSLPGGRPSASC